MWKIPTAPLKAIWPRMLGSRKWWPLHGTFKRLDPTIEVELIEDRWRPKLEIGEAVFCCVDSIETRAAIWRSIGRRVQFWADGRMLADTIRILVAADEVGRRHYPTTLFPGSEAHPGRCTAMNTFDTAEIAAGLHDPPIQKVVAWAASGFGHLVQCAGQ